MLHPAADSEPNSNNSKTHTWAREQGRCHRYYNSPLRRRLPHLCCPLVAPVYIPPAKRAKAAALLQFQVPDCSTGWDQDGTKRSANPSSATDQPLPHIHSFLPPFFPCLGTTVNKTPGDLNSSLYMQGDREQGAGACFVTKGVKEKQRRGIRSGEDGHFRVVRECFLQKEASEQRPAENEGTNHIHIWGKVFQAAGMASSRTLMLDGA